MPVLVGWAAVTDSLAWAPIVLFVVIFCWTPPHFWALAIRYADDYRAADVPMLPAVASIEQAARQMIGYTVALVASTLVLVPVADLGWIYLVAAVVLGAGFLAATIGLARHPSPAASMKVFTYTITYVTVLFVALTVDVLVPWLKPTDFGLPHGRPIMSGRRSNATVREPRTSATPRMSTTDIAPDSLSSAAVPDGRATRRERGGATIAVADWLTSSDSKVIGRQYIGGAVLRPRRLRRARHAARPRAHRRRRHVPRRRLRCRSCSRLSASASSTA